MSFLTDAASRIKTAGFNDYRWCLLAQGRCPELEFVAMRRQVARLIRQIEKQEEKVETRERVCYMLKKAKMEATKSFFESFGSCATG